MKKRLMLVMFVLLWAQRTWGACSSSPCTFAIGACCSDASGTSCVQPYVACGVNADCVGLVGNTVCSGLPDDQYAALTEGTRSSANPWPPPFSACLSVNGNGIQAQQSVVSGSDFVINGLLSFDTSALGALGTVNVTSVILRVYDTFSTSADNLNVWMDWFPWGGACDSSDYTTAGAPVAVSAIDALPISSLTVGTDNDLVLGNVGNVLVNGTTQLRMGLSCFGNNCAARPLHNNLANFRYRVSSAAAGLAPRLIVYYSVGTPIPTVTPTPTITPTTAISPTPNTTPTRLPTYPTCPGTPGTPCGPRCGQLGP